MNVLLGLIVILFVWAVIEFFFMMFSRWDDYGENWISSMIVTIVVTLIVGALIDVDIETTIDQETMLEEQWPDEEPDVSMTIKIEDHEIEEVKELLGIVEERKKMETHQEHYFSEEDIARANEQYLKQHRVVPSNRAYIEASRRRSEIVSYNSDTREACSDTVGCFQAQLIQHTDGSFWACRRNYGACYEY